VNATKKPDAPERSPAELLAEATAAGLSVSEEGSRLVVRGPKRAQELARLLVARKDEILELVRARPAWNQVEADRLLTSARAAVTHAEAEHRAGRITDARLDACRTWVEVCEEYVRDHEFESRRGWDAMQLMRNATRRLAVAAGCTAPRFLQEQGTGS
jgi:hypothetical protein